MAKKQKATRVDEPPNPSSSSSSQPDLKALIEDHSLFFDKIVDLIPPRFYVSSPDADKPWYQGLSKAAKASAKKESRQNLKKARRDRLDPEKQSSTLAVLEQRRQSTTKSSESVAVAAAAAPVTYEELRQRLQQRIKELRSKRNTGTRTTDHKREPEIADDNKSTKRKIHSGAMMLSPEDTLPPEQEEEVMYGKVKVGDEYDKNGGKKKKKKVSKLRELQKAEKLAEMKKDPEKAEKFSWKAAESRAMGAKVHDDPKILKESIKKDKKRQKKSAEKWKERAESTESKRRERQSKRSENIKERIQQKKMRRIEKREKKLMRPGFEGRKEGYINE